MKFVENKEKEWHNHRAHFFGVAAQAMRLFLVNYAISKHRQKRGGNDFRLTFDENVVILKDTSG